MRDLGELLRNCIKFFENDEKQMKEYYEQRLNELGSELKRYQELCGESGANDLVTRQQALFNKMK